MQFNLIRSCFMVTLNLHQAKSELTRERLLRSALDVIQAKGVGQLSLHEVAKTAGMTTGAVQHHFASKAALMMQVLGRLIDTLESSADFWPRPEWSLERRAHHFVEQAWAQLYGQPRFAVAWAAYLAARDDAQISAHIREQRAGIQLRMHQAFVTAFPEMAQAPQAGARIQMVFSTLRGLGLVQPFAPHEAIAPQLTVLADCIQSFLRSTTETP
jgi:AcrR family transcriptional regulator